jgi:hypothetical protein
MTDDHSSLVAVILPRSAWASLAMAQVKEIAQELDDAETEWNPEERESLEECAREHALKTLPVLLEAYGDGGGPGYPTRAEVMELAEEVWARLGERPSDRVLAIARSVVLG